MNPPVRSQRPKTLQDRYLLGEELGKGAHGKVYKGLDQGTGMFVAVKEISLEKIVQADLASITNEIELLKNLSNKNVVKYLGSIQSKTHLYIILEFVENGSLSNIIKPNKFGAFPEALAAVYIAQVLEGLVYLHDQGIIHCDIKGANILTTKDGVVKLADFGVAQKISGPSAEAPKEEGADEHVVGTPYWMAPEVIEMEGVSPASDIWSVGCTAVELLTTKPPYFDLQPMPALFRIVQDETPPMPDDISPVVQDFLRLCFRKDPKLRPDARALLRHPWIHQSCQAQQQKQSVSIPQESVTSTREDEDRLSTAEAGARSPPGRDEKALSAKEGGEEDAGDLSDSDYNLKLRQKIHLHGDTMKTLRAAARAARRQSPFVRHSVGGEDTDQLLDAQGKASGGSGVGASKQPGHQSTSSDVPAVVAPTPQAPGASEEVEGEDRGGGGARDPEAKPMAGAQTPDDRTESGTNTDSGGEGTAVRRRSLMTRSDRGSAMAATAAAAAEAVDSPARKEAEDEPAGTRASSGRPPAPAPGAKEEKEKGERQKGGGRTRLQEGEVIQVGDELLVVGAGGRLKVRRKKEKKEKGEERGSDSGPPSGHNLELTPLASPQGTGGGRGAALQDLAKAWLQFRESEEDYNLTKVFSASSCAVDVASKASRGSKDWGDLQAGSSGPGVPASAHPKTFYPEQLTDAQKERVEAAASMLGVISAAVRVGDAGPDARDREDKEEKERVQRASGELIALVRDSPEAKAALVHGQGVLPLTDALQYGSANTKECAYRVLAGMLQGPWGADVRRALLLSGVMPLLLHHLKPVPDNSPGAPLRLCSIQLIHRMLCPSLGDPAATSSAVGASASPDSSQDASAKDAARALVACRGLSTLVACLEGEYSSHRDMVAHVLGCLWTLRSYPLPGPGCAKDICEQLARAGAYPRLALTISSIARVWAVTSGRLGALSPTSGSKTSGSENTGATHRRLAAASRRSLGISSPTRSRSTLNAPPLTETPYARGSVESRAAPQDGQRDRPGSRGAKDGVSGDAGTPSSPASRPEAGGAQCLELECLSRAADLLLWACKGATRRTSSQHFLQLPLLKKVMELLPLLPPRPLLCILALLRHLSTDPELMEPLQRADGLIHLIPLLTLPSPPPAPSFSTPASDCDGVALAQAADVQAQALLLLFAYCRDSRRRQEIAIEAGLVPALLSLVSVQSPLVHVALPLLCDLAHSSSRSRTALIVQGAPQLFLSLLSPQTVTRKQPVKGAGPGDDVPVAPTAALSYENSVLAHWLPQVLDSLVVCVTAAPQAEESGSTPGIRGMSRQRTPPFPGGGSSQGAGAQGASGEQLLLKKQSLTILLNSFVAWPPAQMPLVLESYLRLLMKFPRVNAALSVEGLASLVVARLDDPSLDSASRLSLLKMIKLVLEQHPPPKGLVLPPDLPAKLQRLMEERRQVPPMHMQRGGEGLGQQVLVKQMASSLLKSLHFSPVS